MTGNELTEHLIGMVTAMNKVITEPQNSCPNCGAIMFFTGGEHGEWWCIAGCDDPVRKEK